MRCEIKWAAFTNSSQALKAGQVAARGKDPKLVEAEKKRVLRSIGIADLGPSAVGWLSN